MNPFPTAACCAALACLLTASLPAQAGQIVQGANLGAMTVWRAGDVDDDGCDDLVYEFATTWEVHSGATGLAVPALSRTRLAPGDTYGGLCADLDVDGCDDLYFRPQNGSRIDFLSGRDGSLLFVFTGPSTVGLIGAADHDADGADDVMVSFLDPATGLSHFQVRSGRGGLLLEDRPFANSITSSRAVQWCGDADGDGYVDLVETLSSFAQRFYRVKAGPDHQQWIGNGTGWAWPAFDTNGDGRDELLTDFGYLDVPTGLLVWPGFFQQTLPMDLDGDGAMDLCDSGQTWSGRTHTPFPSAVTTSFWGVGDLDGDGRDEAVASGVVYEWVGGPASSRVHDRGAAGITSTLSRPRIRHRLRPTLGGTLQFDLNGGLGGGLAFAAIGTALDADLGPIGAPGNRLYVAPFATIGQLADAHGLARRSLNVPNDPGLLGVALSLQWLVCDPAANPLGGATSNALDIVLGG